MASDKSNNLNAPDSFQLQAYSVMDKVARNPKPLWITLGLILAVIVGGYAWKYFTEARAEKLQNAAAEVDIVYESEMKKYTETRESLEKQRDGLVAKQPSPVAGQSPVETPEITALDNQLKVLRPDHSGSSAKYLEFYKTHPKEAVGLSAGLRHVAFVAEKGDLDAAKTQITSIINDSKKFSVIHTQALLLAISIDQDKGDFDSAIKYADQLVSSVGAELLPKALLTKGQAQFLKKDYAGAKATLDKILTEHAGTREAERARGLISLVPAQS